MTTTSLTTQQTVLTLEGAKRISEAAEAEARLQGWAVCIAIVDFFGNLLHFIRMDDTQGASNEVSIGKARAAATFRRPSKALEDSIVTRPAMVTFPVISVQGGLPLIADGKVVGGIGVSGVQSHQDEIVAKAGADVLK